MATTIADFFKYNLWANLLVLDACAGLDDAQLDVTFRGTFGSVRETLVHIIAAEEGYVQRFTGQRIEPALHEGRPFPGFDELRRRARQSGEGLIAIAEQFDAGQVLRLTYQGQLYDVGNMTLWLKSCGLYDRTSTESSNMAFLFLHILLCIGYISSEGL